MALKSMTETGPPLSEAVVRGFEKRFRIDLPEPYRSFLLKYNGGRPSPCCFPIEGLANNPLGGIQVFLGLTDPIDSCNVDWNLEDFNGRMPANLLPIACTDGGDMICLSLFGPDQGHMVFWDYHDERGYPTYDNVYHIANSFEEFIDGLCDDPDLLDIDSASG